MKVLLLGGTGAMGGHLARILSTEGISTFVTTRSIRPNKPNITYIQGNAHDFNFLENVLKKEHFDVCVDFMSYNTEEFNINSRMILPKVGRYVYISSSRVYAESECAINETSPRLLDCCKDIDYLKTDEYAIAKAKQENFLFDGKSHNWTIVRPYITYSKDRLQFGEFEKEVWLKRCLNNKAIVVTNKILTRKTTLTYGKDVAIVLSAICQNEKTIEEIYNPTVSDYLTWKDIFDVYASVIEKKIGIKIKLNYQEDSPLIYDNAAQYQVKYDRYFDRTFDNSKLSMLIDVNRMTSIKDGLSKCIDEFLSNPEFARFDAKKEAICDKITKDIQYSSQFPSFRQAIAYYVQRFIL